MITDQTFAPAEVHGVACNLPFNWHAVTSTARNQYARRKRTVNQTKHKKGAAYLFVSLMSVLTAL